MSIQLKAYILIINTTQVLVAKQALNTYFMWFNKQQTSQRAQEVEMENTCCPKYEQSDTVRTSTSDPKRKRCLIRVVST